MLRNNNAVVRIAYLAFGASLLGAFPALAQSTGSNTATAPSTSTSGGTMALGDKAPEGGLTKTHGDWRASGLVGATVYNDQGDSIGTVNDMLVGSDGTVSNTVISVGGFLGIGTKYVEVPFKNLKLVPSKSNPESGSKEATANAGSSTTTPMNAAGTSGSAGAPATAPGAAPASTTAMGSASTTPAATTPAGAGTAPEDHEYSLVLPGATKTSLTSDPEFKYED
jgi:sporulation protein YlmC with PRC-barrel domain